VVSHGHGELLTRCLDSLDDQVLAPAEVVVVDSGTPGGPPAWLAARPRVTLLALEQNVGFAAAVNRGIEATSGEFVALLNPDAWADRGWLDSLVRAACESSSFSWFASRVLLDDGSMKIDSAGHTLTMAGRGLKRHEGEDSRTAGREAREVLGAPAAASLYCRTTLRDVGAFNETLFMVMEDLEWDLRAQSLGHRCLYVPDATVFHRGSAIRGRGSDLSVLLEERNTLIVLARLVPASVLARMLIPLTLHQIWGAFVKARRGQLSVYVKGLSGFLTRLPSLFDERRRLTRRDSMPEPGRLLELMDRDWHVRRISKRCRDWFWR